jgi:hypothetical protein
VSEEAVLQQLFQFSGETGSRIRRRVCAQASFHQGLVAIGADVRYFDRIISGYILTMSLHRGELHPNRLVCQIVSAELGRALASTRTRAVR